MMSLGLLLILSVLYLPGGLASLRTETFRAWRDSFKLWWKDIKDDLSGETRRREQREKQLRERRNVF
jgi:branched-chain amino acid transport system permease protein